MKYLICFFIPLILAGCSQSTQPKKEVVKIILDTDLGPDYDDVGALAFLHAMADSGRAEILATVASNKHELVAPSIEVINTYFDRPRLPIGAPKGNGVSMTASQHWPDSITSKYPHLLKSTSDAEDAVKVYRRVLASQPDSSVTIVTVGFLTHLSNLLKSQADSISPLNGAELVAKKVGRLVSMAGCFPEGREFNVFIDSVASEYVFNEWPGRIIFTGFEIGSKIFTGLKLIASDIKNSPVKDVFRISIPMSPEDRNGRMSWDETAVMIAVYGTEPFYETTRGRIIIDPDGSNKWQDDAAGKQMYVKMRWSVPETEKFIEERMMHTPNGKK
jgi:inosine-uridine nucleoside N-ribohydrolase